VRRVKKIRMVPTAEMEVLLELPLHVMNEVKTQAGIYRLMFSHKWKFNLQISVVLENLGTRSMNPTKMWG
jgi:hypothetical protein